MAITNPVSLFNTTGTLTKGWYDGREAVVYRLQASLAAAASGTLAMPLPARCRVLASKIQFAATGSHATAAGRVGIFINATIAANTQVALSEVASSGVLVKNTQSLTTAFGALVLVTTSTQALTLMTTDGGTTTTGGNVTGTFNIELVLEQYPAITDVP